MQEGQLSLRIIDLLGIAEFDASKLLHRNFCHGALMIAVLAAAGGAPFSAS